MSSLPKQRYTLEEYFKLERQSGIRYEYWNGEVFAMSGAQPNHNRVSQDVGRVMGNLLLGRCEVFGSDQRVKVMVGSPYLYPDLSVACGKADFEAIGGLLALTNPVLICEVLSPSTVVDDRKAKFLQYQTIPTLKEYLLIDPDRVLVIQYNKQADGTWAPTETIDSNAALFLVSVQISLTMAEIYRRVGT